MNVTKSCSRHSGLTGTPHALIVQGLACLSREDQSPFVIPRIGLSAFLLALRLPCPLTQERLRDNDGNRNRAHARCRLRICKHVLAASATRELIGELARHAQPRDAIIYDSAVAPTQAQCLRNAEPRPQQQDNKRLMPRALEALQNPICFCLRGRDLARVVSQGCCQSNRVALNQTPLDCHVQRRTQGHSCLSHHTTRKRFAVATTRLGEIALPRRDGSRIEIHQTYVTERRDDISR